MPLAQGTSFAGYTILGLLGSGGMGEVYLAQHPRLPRRDALKVLPKAATADHQFRERFQREADVAATLYHPHIVAVHDRGEFEGQLWIAMDYVDGTDAATLVRDRFPAGMPVGDALAIISAIAGALDYAHQRGLLHRDVKPANILLTDPEAGERRILLADFGIARYLGDPSGLTATNLTLGTVAYAAPEQLMGSAVDGRADQYALAATAFHLLTGAPPFRDANPVAVISAHLTGTPPKLSDRRPELAPLDGAVATALAKDPNDRFGRCRDFAEALTTGVSTGVSTGSAGPKTYDIAGAVGYPDAGSGVDPAYAGSTLISAEAPRGPAGLSPAGRLGNGTPATAAPEPGAVEDMPAAPTRHRRRWLLGGLVAASALLLAVLGKLALGGGTGGQTDRASAPSPASATRTSVPAVAPPRSVSGVPPAPLDGVYRVDIDRAQQTFNDSPDPQPPNVTTWWAFRSACTPGGCVADAVMLDSDNHQKVSSTAGPPVVLDFREGAWQSRPQTLQFPCVSANGTPSKETVTQVLSLQPHTSGPLRGVMTVTVQTNECGQQGGQISIPAVAERVGAVPPDVTVPNPAPGSPPAPTTTPSR
ncbi:MAG: protein kinase [Mycobacterium sp.]|uniref:serine/threonine-protein kinase n=1 Tax=Mycobacterium sp. TaxID=1785 RepID=UPI00263793EC|nr:serine/threonine-protein kinase [Mycobacterium sp.]MDI3314298.1 protein kinase [Mycobacterium sp.]